MKLEHVFIFLLMTLAFLFTALLIYRLSRRRPRVIQVAGYQHAHAHDLFHHCFFKNYHGFRISFYPLVESGHLAQKALLKKEMRLDQNDFKGIVCHLEIIRIEKELLNQILRRFDRVEEHNQNTLSLFQEAINFNTTEMQDFVERLDRAINHTLLKHGQLVV